jgi:hypothetical protein
MFAAMIVDVAEGLRILNSGKLHNCYGVNKGNHSKEGDERLAYRTQRPSAVSE